VLRQVASGALGGWVCAWWHPDSRFAFQRPVRQTHRTPRTQGNIFTDADIRVRDGNRIADRNNELRFGHHYSLILSEGMLVGVTCRET